MLFWAVFPKNALKCLGRNLGMIRMMMMMMMMMMRRRRRRRRRRKVWSVDLFVFAGQTRWSWKGFISWPFLSLLIPTVNPGVLNGLVGSPCLGDRCFTSKN